MTYQQSDVDNAFMDLKLIVLADFANISTDGKLNIMGIFNRITVTGVPAMLPRAHVVMRWAPRTGEYNREFKCRILCVGEDGKQVFHSPDMPFMVRSPEVPGGTRDINLIVQLGNVMFPAYGSYELVVQLGEETKDTLDFLVVRQPDSAAPPKGMMQ